MVISLSDAGAKTSSQKRCATTGKARKARMHWEVVPRHLRPQLNLLNLGLLIDQVSVIRCRNIRGMTRLFDFSEDPDTGDVELYTSIDGILQARLKTDGNWRKLGSHLSFGSPVVKKKPMDCLPLLRDTS